MESSKLKREKTRKSRVFRVRKKLRGNSEKPRLSVFKSNKHIFAQLIDDEKGVTLAGTSTLAKENRKGKLNQKSKDAAKHIGVQIAKMAKKHKVTDVVFDRGRYKYHGHIAELANAAREEGLKF